MRTLYRNGRVLAPSAPGATAVLLDGPHIAWIGDEADAAEQTGAVCIDLGGALLAPAFVDAHVHLTSTGLALGGLDLTAIRSLRELLDHVERAARASRGRPVLGSGWDEAQWPERRPPTRTELDRASYGGAVYLSRVDVHSAVVSSALISASPGVASLVGYDASGWLTRDAHDAVRQTAHASLTPGHAQDAQRTALRHAASLGIACVHEMAGPSISGPADLQAALEISDTEPMPEVIGYWGELFGVDTAIELGALGAGGDLFCDGSLGSHTAALHEPYADRPATSGELRFDTADLVEHLRQCATAGVQSGFHAIGDAAVDQVLDALEAVGRRGPGAPLVRIEHVEMAGDPHRIAKAGVVASMQPMFDRSWGGPSGMYAERLGAERAAGMNDFAALAAAGVPLAFGSDAPVTQLSPWDAVRAALNPHRQASAIGAWTAFAAHTTGGWQASGKPGGGQLTVGGPATFAVWRGDDRTDPAHLLPDLGPDAQLPRCVRTVRAGTTIYTDPEGGMPDV